MTPRKRWFALLGPALAVSLAAAASAQPKGAPGNKPPAPGIHAGRVGPPGGGPEAKDKAKAKDKGKDEAKAKDKGKDEAKAKDKAEAKDDKGKDEAKAKDKAKDDKGKDEAKAKDKGEHEAGARPRPPGAPGGGLRPPPDFRRRHEAAPTPELRKKWQERRADQMKRRRAALQQLRETWGEEQLNKPQVKAAIKVHAWRMARLKRVRELALQDPDGKDLVERTDKLIEKEQERFRLQMARMKRGSDVGTVGDAATVPPGPPPAVAKGPAQKQEAPKPATAEKQEGAK